MKQFWATFTGQLLAGLLPLIAVGIVGLLVWRKIFGADKTVEGVVNNTIDAAVSIPGGVASVIGSAVRGESSTTYITFAEQQLMAAKNLAAARGQGVAQ